MSAIPVIVTRPEPDASKFAAALNARGFRPIVSPVMEIGRLPTPKLAQGSIVAFTSANGPRNIEAPASGVAFAIGAATATAARDAGWREVVVSGGDVRQLAETIAHAHQQQPLLGPVIHIAGSHRAGDLAAALQAHGVPSERRIAYEAREATALRPGAQDALRGGGIAPIVTLFSPRTAEIFLRLIARSDLSAELAATVAVCLSNAVADVARLAVWRGVKVAKSPETAAMLAAISDFTA